MDNSTEPDLPFCKKHKMLFVRIICYVLFFTVFTVISLEWVKRDSAAADLRYGMNNGKQIASALKEFESYYGRFPDETTAKAVTEFFAPTEIDLKDDFDKRSSNARFRQLIHSGICMNENIFHAATSYTDHMADGNDLPGEAIKHDECGFAYVENVRTNDAIARPVAIAPASLTQGEFEYEPFLGKAVVVWTDGSVSSLSIDRSTNHVMLDGKNLFDPMHPIWGGTEPRLLMPEGK